MRRSGGALVNEWRRFDTSCQDVPQGKTSTEARAVGGNDLGIAQVDREFPGQNPHDFCGGAGAHPHHALLGDPGHVRRHDHVVEGEIGMVRRQRLGREHVERRAADAAVAQRRDQRLVVDHRAARHVDDQRARLHQADAPRVDQTACFRGQRAAEHDDVARRHERRRRRETPRPTGPPGGCGW